MSIERRLRPVAVAAILVLGLATTMSAAQAGAPEPAGSGVADTPVDHDGRGHHGGGREDLVAARLATAPFHSIDVARAAGWPEDATGCLEFPDGYLHGPPGAMGLHYVNGSLFNDGGVLDPTRPEALLYEPQADGSLRLTAVEYIVPERDLPRSGPAPVLFGRKLHFHEQFDAWALHVWLWRQNPYGLYADVNPRVTCRHAAAVR